MKIKMSQAMNLNGLYDKVRNQVLSIKTTYKFSKLFGALDKEHTFYRESLDKIIMDYSEKDENGNPILTPDKDGYTLQNEYIETANQKFQELLNLDVELPDVKFTLDELEGAPFTIEEFNLFLPFIED